MLYTLMALMLNFKNSHGILLYNVYEYICFDYLLLHNIDQL